MADVRKRFSADEKAKIVLEILKGDLTQQQITAKYGVHSTQLHNWKKQALVGIVSSFSGKQERQAQNQNQLVDELYQKIGKLKVELDWLKKNPTYSGDWRNLIDRNGPISIRRQCELLGKNRASLYYKPIKRDAETLLLMKLIDEEYTKHPFYGTCRMRSYLRNQGYPVNRKHVQRLYRLMGLEAVYPKPKLSKRNSAHKVYPYLLCGVEINRCNQVWSTDITYIRLKNGFVYLMVIIDWYSRYVIDWQLSTTLDADFCEEALSRALMNGKCEIFNTDRVLTAKSRIFYKKVYL